MYALTKHCMPWQLRLFGGVYRCEEMFTWVLLVLVITGSSSSYAKDPCGVCLCTFYDHGCVTADCSSRNITSLPAHVPNQTCNLILRDNEFQTIQDGEFQRLVNLTILDLSANLIDVISEKGFSGLSKLISLNLSVNHLDFHLNNTKLDAFKPLLNLKSLQLNRNRYNEYPDKHLSVLHSLKNLTLDGLQNHTFGQGFLQLTNLTSINLSGDTSEKCSITSLYKKTFDYVSRIKTLTISHCNISYIEPGAFSPLQNIDKLDLSCNENMLFHGVRNVTYGLQTSQLRHLVINKIVPDYAVCVVIDKALVEYLENMSSLEIIDADKNRIEQFGPGALKALRSVKFISAKDSRLTTGPYLKELDVLTNLSKLDISGRHFAYSIFHHFQEESTENGHFTDVMNNIAKCGNEILQRSVFMETHTHPINSHLQTDKKVIFNVRIPEKLKVLDYSYSQLYYDLSDVHLPENSLERIDLSHNVLSSWPGPVFGVKHVKHLDLSNNIARNMSLTFLENFHSLQFLNISWNFLRLSIQKDKNGTLLRNLSKLKTLDLSHNVLFKLPYRFLEGASSLEELYIDGNSIYSLALNYTTNTHLRFINASHNNLRFIPVFVRKTLDHLADKNKLHLDLSINPFDCTCDIEHLHFLDWLYNTKVRLLNKDQYKCVEFVNNEPITVTPLSETYQNLKASCKVYVALAMGLLALVVLITTTSLLGVVYRYRWRLIYWYYVLKRKMKIKSRMDYENPYEFDAFVSYADKDLDFVTTTLISKLERKEKMNLYVRDRESVPGATIAENIIDGIQRSRKCILLISKASLAKKWNTYELQLANMETISTKRQFMIIVLLESVLSDEMPQEILYFIKNNPPHQYPFDDPANTDMFWGSLVEDIRA